MRKGDAKDSFSTKEFTRTISHRDFVTSFSLALLLFACFEITNYYLSEDWVSDSQSIIMLIFLLIILPINHVFYRAEHKRPNNFIGRNIHDHIFLTLLVTIFMAKYFLQGASSRFSASELSNVLPAIIVVIFWVIIFELFVALIKRLLNLVGWQIL